MKVYIVETQECIDNLDSIKDRKYIEFLHETYTKDNFDLDGDLCLENSDDRDFYEDDKVQYYNKR